MDNLQSKTLFLTVYDPRSSNVKSVFDCRLFGVITSLRERLRTHKVFTKDQCFYLYYHEFSIKSYVLDVY